MRYAQLKFAEECNPRKRGKPLSSSPKNAEEKGISICTQKRKKDGQEVAYKTGEQQKKETTEKGHRQEARKQAGGGKRGKMSSAKLEIYNKVLSDLKSISGKPKADSLATTESKPETAKPESSRLEAAKPEAIKWKPNWDPAEEGYQKLKKEEKEIKDDEARRHKKMISDLDRKIKENKDPSLGQSLRNFKNDLRDYVSSPNKAERLINALGEMAKKGIITPQTIMANLAEKD